MRETHERQETGFNEFLGREEEEKEMETHSSILALEIPWAEEPYDWATEHAWLNNKQQQLFT